MAKTPEKPEDQDKPDLPDASNPDDDYDDIISSESSDEEPSFGEKVNQGKTPKDKWGELINRRKQAETIAAKDKSKASSPTKPEPLHPKIDRKQLGIQTIGAERLLKDGLEVGALNELAAVEQYFKNKDHSEVVKLDKKTKIAIPRKKGEPVTGTLSFSVIKGVIKDNDGRAKEELYALYRGKMEGLGAGAYGKVKIAQNIRTGEWVAVKIQEIEIPKGMSKEESAEYLREEKAKIETEALAELAVGNGLSEFMVFNEKAPKENKPGYVKGYIILKLLPGMPLNQQIEGYIEEVEQDNRNIRAQDPAAPLNTVDSSKLITDPLEKLEVGILALEEIKKAHDLDVIHRDLKPHNMMYDRLNKKLNIFDWGLAINLKTEGSRDHTYSNIQSIGSPPYMSPEISSSEVRAKQKEEGGKMNLREIREAFIKEEGIKKEKLTKTYVYSKKSDIYSMGIILRDEMKILENSLANAPHQKKLENLVASMTHDDPSERPSVAESIKILKEIYEVRFKAQQERLKKEEAVKLNQFFEKYTNLEAHYKEGFFTKGKKKAYLREIQTEVDAIKSDIENARGLDLKKMGQLEAKIREVQKKVSAEKGNSENKRNLNKLCTEMLQDLKALNRIVLAEVYAPPKASITLPITQSATQKPEASLSQKENALANKPILPSKPARPERPDQTEDLKQKVKAHLQNLEKPNAPITHQFKQKTSETSGHPISKPGTKPPKPASPPPPLPPTVTKPGKS